LLFLFIYVTRFRARFVLFKRVINDSLIIIIIIINCKRLLKDFFVSAWMWDKSSHRNVLARSSTRRIWPMRSVKFRIRKSRKENRGNAPRTKAMLLSSAEQISLAVLQSYVEINIRPCYMILSV